MSDMAATVPEAEPTRKCSVLWQAPMPMILRGRIIKDANLENHRADLSPKNSPYSTVKAAARVMPAAVTAPTPFKHN